MAFLRLFLVAVFVSGFMLNCVNASNCFKPCEEVDCGPKPVCKGGVMKGHCGCCDICAQVEGEMCGGFRGYSGRCDEGLRCHVKPRLIPMMNKDGQITYKEIEPELHAIGKCVQ